MTSSAPQATVSTACPHYMRLEDTPATLTIRLRWHHLAHVSFFTLVCLLWDFVLFVLCWNAIKNRDACMFFLPLMLIMGLGMQLIAWHEDFVQSLVDRGYRVIRFDNRDIGLSENFDHLDGGPGNNILIQD